jgi:hypothetical protein
MSSRTGFLMRRDSAKTALLQSRQATPFGFLAGCFRWLFAGFFMR